MWLCGKDSQNRKQEHAKLSSLQPMQGATPATQRTKELQLSAHELRDAYLCTLAHSFMKPIINRCAKDKIYKMCISVQGTHVAIDIADCEEMVGSQRCVFMCEGWVLEGDLMS